LSTAAVEYLLKRLKRESLEQRKEQGDSKMPPSTGSVAMSQPDDALAAIRDYLQRLRFGSIAITVHEGKIVQLDVTEKRRLAR
jgi:hypothetical protein